MVSSVELGKWPEDRVPIGIVESTEAYRRNLARLMGQHDGQWVAFNRSTQVGIGSSKTALYQQCLTQGIPRGEFIVRRIVPEVERTIEDRSI